MKPDNYKLLEAALNSSQREATISGTAELTMDDIIAEIAAFRRERRSGMLDEPNEPNASPDSRCSLRESGCP